MQATRGDSFSALKLRQVRVTGSMIPVGDYMRQLGMDPASEDNQRRVAESIRLGELGAVRHRGVVFVDRPGPEETPPGYLAVREFAARNLLSKQRVYALLHQGRVFPAIKRRVGKYHRWLVASWATIQEAA